MCGLVGVMGNITFKEDKAFRQLLYIDGLRGMHSTGVASVNKTTKAWKTLKAAQAPDMFMSSEDFHKDFMSGVHTVLMGHNRYATMGSITTKNAHPFVHDNIIGAHNGTLKNKYVLPEGHKFQVDSDALYNAINQVGLDEIYEKIDGAWAMSWIDGDKDTLNFIRNDERELYLCYSTDRKTMFWASEKYMLKTVLTRNKIAHQEPFLLKEHHHYCFEVLGDGKPLSGITVTDKSELRDSPVKKQSEHSTTNSSPSRLVGTNVEFSVEKVGKNEYNQPFLIGTILEKPYTQVRCYFQAKTKEGYEIEEGDYLIGRVTYWNRKDRLLHLNPHSLERVELPDEEEKGDIVGHDGEMITAAEFHRRTRSGCSWCSSPAINEYEDILWLKHDEFVCSHCKERDEVQEYIQ